MFQCESYLQNAMNDYLIIFTLVISSFLVQGYDTITPSESAELFELFHTSNSGVDDFKGFQYTYKLSKIKYIYM